MADIKEGESVSSSKVSLKSLLCTLIIDVYEGRDGATIDVLGTYLHA